MTKPTSIFILILIILCILIYICADTKNDSGIPYLLDATHVARGATEFTEQEVSDVMISLVNIEQKLEKIEYILSNPATMKHLHLSTISNVKRIILPKDKVPGWHGKKYSQRGEEVYAVIHFFSNLTHVLTSGVFLEIGALDGVWYSNSKYLEDSLGWTGILIEAQPENAKRLKQNRKQNYIITNAICEEGVDTVLFQGGQATGGIVIEDDPEVMAHHKAHNKNGELVEVSCTTMSEVFYDYEFQIDLLTIDMEGGEMMFLKLFPWDQIEVGCLMVECTSHKEEMKDFFLETLGGFTFIGVQGGTTNDLNMVLCKTSYLNYLQGIHLWQLDE